MTWRYFGRLIDPVPVLKAVAAAVAVYLLMSVPDTYSLVILPFACLAGLGSTRDSCLLTGAVTRAEVVVAVQAGQRPRPPPIDEEL